MDSDASVEVCLHEIGSNLMRRKNTRSGTIDAYEGFTSFFGASSQVLSVVWNALVKNDLLQGATQEHLLWACMLMKQYTGDRVLAGIADVDKATF